MNRLSSATIPARIIGSAALLAAVLAALVTACGPEEEAPSDAAVAEGEAVMAEDEGRIAEAEPAAAEAARTAFMESLARHCGRHFPGRLTLEPEGDPMLTGAELLVVHFRDCSPDEVRIPFHIEIEDADRWDRSRTWYLIRHDDRLELRHDHREEDGSESERTWYGGFTETAGTATRQDFVSPERTEAAGVPVGWRVEIEPGVRYVYGTTYDGDYDWRIEFDLGRPLDGPPPQPWGHDRDPSRVAGPP